MAKLFFKDKPIIGLDISQTGIKIMSVDTSKWLVSGYGSIDLDPKKMMQSLEDKSTYLPDNLKKLLDNHLVGSLPSDHVVIGVPTSRSFSRTFTLPAEAEGHLKDAVEVEADQYIPIPVSSLYYDYEIIERTKEQLTITMCATPKQLIDTSIGAAEAVGLRPVMIEPGINSISRVLQATEDGHLPTVVVDIGPAGTDIAILDGSVRVTGAVGVGGNTFTLDIAKKLGVTLENAHQLKVLNGLAAGPRQEKITGALEPSLKRIVAETKKIIRYYSERLESQHKLEQLLIVGGGSNVPAIGDYFTNALVMPARVASPWQKLNFGKLPQPAKQVRSRYITVAGLASVKPEAILE